MRSAILIAACAALVKAQDLDWDAIIAAGPASTASVPVVYVTTPGATTTQTATTVAYTEAAAVSSVAAAMSADPSDAAPLDSDVSRRKHKRDLLKRSTTATTCIAQPTGSGPTVTSPSDNAAAFLAYTPFATSASAQATPSGYVNTFTNLDAANNAYGYMGYTLLTEYNSQKCADKCTAINGCQAFNIYFERDPTVSPDAAGCPNPSSTTQIKCVFWGGPVDTSNANNYGQTRASFQVVIAGSNGYVNQSIAQPAGYNEGIYLGTSAISAPVDCAGDDTYVQGAFFNSGPFNAQLCATACSEQSAYAYAHPPSTGKPKVCKFFNTYLLYKNGAIYGQNCAMYSESWTSSVASNSGYYYGSDHYTVGFSYTFSNSTDAGSPRIACDVASASSVIGSSTLQGFCSTLLGYSNLATTTTTTVTPLSTFTTVTTSTAVEFQKRALSTPAALTKFKASAISSACALQATQQTSAVTAVVTSTAAPSVTTFTSTAVVTSTTATA